MSTPFNQEKASQVFLSYAHDDNAKPEDRQIGWVDYFDRSLSIDLRERGLLEVKLWRDKRDLHPMDFLDPSLTRGVGDSDIIIAIVSPLYVKRPYCLQELQEFIRNKGALGSNTGAELVLTVHKRPLKDNECPDVIRGKIGVQFYEFDQEKRQFKPFFDGFGTAVKDKYWEAIRNVGDALERSLASVTDVAAPVAPALSEKLSKTTIFLAQPSGDIHDAHWRVRQELMSLGCRVVPEEALASNGSEAELMVRDALGRAEFSVHLLGATPGFIPDGTNIPVVRLQFELAGQRCIEDRSFRRFIWLPPNLGATNDRYHAALMEGLDDGGLILPQDEVVRLGLQSFQDVLRDALTSRREPLAAKRSPTCVYLLHDEKDTDEVRRLGRMLFKLGYEVKRPVYEEGPEAYAEEHQRCLEKCDAVLLYWGSTSERVVRRRLDELAEAAWLRDSKPLWVRAVYLAEPRTADKEDFGSHLTDMILSGFDEPNEAVLDPLLRRLSGREAVK
jgi:hypothetical protein